MTNEAQRNEDTVELLVGRYTVFDGKGWGKDGTILVCAPCRREKKEPWFFFDEPRFPWRVRDLKREGFFIRANNTVTP